jgi:hypothetical protein
VTLSASGTRPFQIVASTLIGASVDSTISGTDTAILTSWRADWDIASQAAIVVRVGKIWVTSAFIGSRAVAAAAVARARN